MKNWWLLFLFLMACSNDIIVRTDSDTDLKGWPYTKYSWLDNKQIESRNNPLEYNELTDKRIKSVTNIEFKEKGYKLDTLLPDVLVHYHIITDERTKVLTEPTGYHYGPYWLRSRVNVIEYDEGTIIIDVMDSKNKNLIWRGWAVSFIDKEEMVSKELIDKSVKKIFIEFPGVQNITTRK